MILKDLYIHNYKSFYDTYIEFDKMNILVAPNNAGKSNLIDVLEFINIALEYDIERAIKEKGGFKNILNYNSNEEKIVIEFTLEYKEDIGNFFKISGINENKQSIQHSCIIFKGFIKIRLTFSSKKNIFSLLFDIAFKTSKSATIKDITYKELNIKKNNTKNKRLKYCNFSISKKIDLETKKISNKIFFNKSKNKKYIEDNLSLITRAFRIQVSKKYEYIGGFRDFNLSTFYFDTKIIQNEADKESDSKLQKDGSNLGKNLSFIKEFDKKNNTDIFEKISLSLTGIVEEIDNIDIQVVAGQYILIFKERSGKEININTISDGTINLVATITALHQPNDKTFMLCFEEPERHLHLKAVNYLLDEFRNSDKQILITTHSSEIINHANLNEIIFMYRNSDGDTQTIRADKIKNLKGKLKRLGYKRDLDISSLIDENILGDLEDYQ